MLISNTVFISNSAALIGGAVWQVGVFTGQEHRIENSLFARNIAGSNAAALSLGGSGNTNSIIHTTIVDSNLNPLNAISFGSGTAYITNTIITGHSIGISITGAPSPSKQVYEDYNLFSGVAITSAGVVTSGGHSLSGNPLFVDPSTDNYHIGLGSAAIDKGTDAGISTDIDGDTRPIGVGFDIGYDEFALNLPNKLYLPLIFKN